MAPRPHRRVSALIATPEPRPLSGKINKKIRSHTPLGYYSTLTHFESVDPPPKNLENSPKKCVLSAHFNRKKCAEITFCAHISARSPRRPTHPDPGSHSLRCREPTAPARSSDWAPASAPRRPRSCSCGRHSRLSGRARSCPRRSTGSWGARNRSR
jgi:hypothetical protein